jgi:hypothetical protein
MEAATKYRVGKYRAVALMLESRIAVARGDPDAAERALLEAIDVLSQFPVPVVAWKVWAALGNLRRQTGAHEAARSAFGEAVTIVQNIAANVGDEALRNTFLTSALVRGVFEGQRGELS